jgi:hypothetical protein
MKCVVGARSSFQTLFHRHRAGGDEIRSPFLGALLMPPVMSVVADSVSYCGTCRLAHESDSPTARGRRGLC